MLYGQTLRDKTKNDPNRHAGVSNKNCSCGLIHDDDLPSTEELRNLVIDKLGGECQSSECRWLNKDGTLGCRDRGILQVDHVYSDGNLDRTRQAHTYWRKVLKEIEAGSDRYQLLCANCNWVKRDYSHTAWKKLFGKKKSHVVFVVKSSK